MTVTPVRGQAPVPGAATARPRAILRAEGGVLLVAALVAFAVTDEAWWLVPALLFVPDLFMVGYARSSRLGALTYNLAHSYPIPAAVGAVGLWQDAPLALAVALLWLAHIGMDRALGYGLKYDSDFKDTHLGRIGRRGGAGSQRTQNRMRADLPASAPRAPAMQVDPPRQPEPQVRPRREVRR
ncbi:MAG: hypothetical protein JWN77_1090 [Frankiales bacterium]|jgi:hypothetical protein|nr:hypothetical protein [Frankiales bacterium]